MSIGRRQGILRPVVSADDHQRGPADAPVTLVEYGDFQCPWCLRAHSIVLALEKQFDTTLRFVFRNFPLTVLHPNALHAAVAAESVNATSGQDAYWRMHHLIFEHQHDSPDALADAFLLEYATMAGGDPERVKRDLESGALEERVQRDFISGVRSGVNGTPTFFINGERFDGNWINLREFAAAIDRAALIALPSGALLPRKA